MSWQWKLIIENCTGCGICFDVCQQEAIHMPPDMPYPEPAEGQCSGCMDCARECPFEAIEVNEFIQKEVV